MPNIEVTIGWPSSMVAADAYDAARAALEDEKARHPHLLFSSDPAFTEDRAGSTLTARLPGTVNPDYVPAPAPVSEPEPEEEEVAAEEEEKPERWKRKRSLKKKN